MPTTRRHDDGPKIGKSQEKKRESAMIPHQIPLLLLLLQLQLHLLQPKRPRNQRKWEANRAEIVELRRDNGIIKLDHGGRAVLPWIREVFFEEDAREYHSNDLKSPKNNFQGVRYKRKPKVEPGKSTRLAINAFSAISKPSPIDSSAESVQVFESTTEPTIEIDKGVRIPVVDPTFNLDGRDLRRLILEDTLTLEKATRLIIFVSKDHPSFTNTFVPIIQVQTPCRASVMIEKESFFQIEALVHANISRERVVSGILTASEFCKSFSFTGGAALSLSFPGTNVAIELKFAEILKSCRTIQLWGKIPKIEVSETSFGHDVPYIKYDYRLVATE